MFGPGIIYVLVTLALVGLAIAAHVKSAALNLPIAPGLTVLIILLPIFAAINAFCRPRLLAAKRSPLRLQQLLPSTLQTFQGILISVFTTLLLQNVMPGSGNALVSCALGTRWQRMFAGKDGESIRRIQDLLDCCGFNSVKDRAWPFPPPGSGAATCASSFQRTAACVGPWTRALGRYAGMDLGVVLAVALLQVATILLSRGSPFWREAWWAQSWGSLFYGQEHDAEQQRRPLLRGVQVIEEEDDDGESRTSGLSQTSHRIAYGTGANGSGGESGRRYQTADYDDEVGWARHADGSPPHTSLNPPSHHVKPNLVS